MNLQRLTAIAYGKKYFFNFAKMSAAQNLLFLTLPKKIFKFFTTSPVTVRMFSQAFMVIGR